jgi:hypothetical protein
MENIQIINPLLINLTIDTEEKKNCVFILTKMSDNPINPSIYKRKIDKNLFEEICKNLILYKTSINILKNENHKKNVLILSSDSLNIFNKNNYILSEKNFVLLILDIKFENIKLYLSQYEKVVSLEDIFKLITMNSYFNNDNLYIKNKFRKYILELEESNYWLKSNNCEINLSKMYVNRNFKLNYLKNNNSEFNDYLLGAFDNTTYVDPSIYVNKIYNYKMEYDNIFTKDDINKLFDNFNYETHEKDVYLLLCNLIISKKHCHLILTNEKCLEKNRPIINKYCHLFRYLLGYGWLTLYFEESKKKSFITKNDRFVFNIDTASKLPVFPYIAENHKLNPYSTLLVDDNILDKTNNLFSVRDLKQNDITITLDDNISRFKNINNGICNLQQFKKRLNIFTTGLFNDDIFKDINWEENKMAISGSVIAACIQVYHPLMNLFEKYETFNERLNRYFNEYYAQADIDVMILTKNNEEFYDKVQTIYNQLVVNICNIYSYAEPSHVKLISEKQIYLFVTKDDISKYIINENTPTLEKIIRTLDMDETILLFVDIFNVEFEKYKKSMNYDKVKYSDFYDLDNIKFKIRLTKDYYEDCKVKINYKYKITSQHLNHSFEIFTVDNNDFFATVHTFHLPCVRGYYDGIDVYLLPSCITSHLTYMNIDYKYFAGTQSPMEILNKYRMRGFGTWLNKNEIGLHMKYVVTSPSWKNLYGNDSSLGEVNLNSKLFQPRIYNIDNYHDCSPVDIDIGYTIPNIPERIKIKTVEDYFYEIDNRFGIVTSNQSIKYLNNLQTINTNGSVNPIKKWVIETTYELMNL